ncbi:SMODS domain-containing nucleotidyltransferase [Kluyvera cryocrescens]|uniref:SMODS domain-containing nucleotidyltransferase n=1 Tax=Kluyvera cryocrescens TaxID=580 RepID=UPI00248C831B|nr:nucleotidyltransferase domain-containing protein [Kluyvera cryocrescens]
MTVSTHLEYIKNNAYQKDITITKSITTIKNRLNGYFAEALVNHFVFGSYSRDTMLPRTYDPYSDVDYMVVFKDVVFQPQAYLNKLKSFVSYYYKTSEIKQSHPTIQLNLNHITFELVPASYNALFGYQIPSTQDFLGRWMNTNPNAFNTDLTHCNKNNHSLIKPLIRIMKYWNANAGYVFDSYQLETKIVGFNFFFAYNLKDYFYSTVEQLQLDLFSPQWKKDKIQQLKHAIMMAKLYEQQGNTLAAESQIKRILP